MAEVNDSTINALVAGTNFVVDAGDMFIIVL